VPIFRHHLFTVASRDSFLGEIATSDLRRRIAPGRDPVLVPSTSNARLYESPGEEGCCALASLNFLFSQYWSDMKFEKPICSP